MTSIVDKMPENRLRWLRYYLKREEAKVRLVNKMFIKRSLHKTVCSCKWRKRKIEKEIVGCDGECIIILKALTLFLN